MFLKKLILHNYKQFKGLRSFSFDKINLICGKNGAGKTNLLESLLFCLYGYTGKYKKSDIPNKEDGKDCYVISELTKNNDYYKIQRYIDNKIVFMKNEEGINFHELTMREFNNYIENIFGDWQNFKKFRLISSYDNEINFLEKGEKTVKKILLNFDTKKIISIKDELQKIKREREIFNKDNLNLNPFYPSVKRLEVLKKFEDKFEKQLTVLEKLINSYYNDLNILNKNIGSLNKEKDQLSFQKYSILNSSKCPLCNKDLLNEESFGIIKDITDKLKILNTKLYNLNEKMKELNSNLNYNKTNYNLLNKKLEKIRRYKLLLQNKLEYKKYIYTSEDVEVVKEAIYCVDNFQSIYLVNKIKHLEPIINSLLGIINYKIYFSLDDDKFKIYLIDDKNNKWLFNQMSSGQQLIIQLAFKIALLLEKRNNGLIIADEGLSALDEYNLYNVIEIFKHLPFQLVLVLHRFESQDKNINIINLS